MPCGRWLWIILLELSTAACATILPTLASRVPHGVMDEMEDEWNGNERNGTGTGTRRASDCGHGEMKQVCGREKQRKWLMERLQTKLETERLQSRLEREWMKWERRQNRLEPKCLRWRKSIKSIKSIGLVWWRLPVCRFASLCEFSHLIVVSRR